MMIMLENSHRIIKDTLEARFYSEKQTHISVKCGDFDGSSYLLYIDPKAKNLLSISVQLRQELYEVLKSYGMQDTLKEVYGDIVKDTPVKDYHITLEIDLDKIDDNKKKEYLESIPLIKRYIMKAPFEHAFKKFEAGEKTDKPIKLPYRENESVYLSCSKDSLVITFTLRFKDPDDVSIAKVFMQEFADAKVGGAPSVSFSHRTKPLEIKSVDEDESDTTGFVSMVLFKRHLEGKKRNTALDNLINFRPYFHYHLKCSKAYMHIRMRTRVAALLEVLNQAKFEKHTKTKQKKTASGRFFQRN
eukprot:gb/GECH01012007.1/.p1 GENE.gb/GECH01012007.1/~~gb/GECH01012007.1/.p1  ORF type:complete len:302 (+),score=80.74 gb/GECH01012007.1/:1-906(+)